MGKSLVVVEGHGEMEAALNLLHRLCADLGFGGAVWQVGGRCNALRSERVVMQECERLRTRAQCDRVLFLQDDEDGCPREDGPKIARWVRAQRLPFPAAVTLFYREYETLFLPGLHRLAGRPLRDARGRPLVALREDARFDGNPELVRDAKAVLNRFFPSKHPYRETTHQLALTRQLDFDVLRASELPCFGTLENALRFLFSSTGSEVYPTITAG
jgi:hypothetical protein